ncbi:rhodanese-like domain-containing protein [Sphingomonas sp.]|uniref:rhodanese-like domain-containing protein n=1 Tax=Sphingomonas sp. TaxID=28214 RepID=UPI001B09C730|nr:rhodanese-like domain-containing protein [Sphingomonas sp.]MBO9712448.1 DUF2892 domain-containing protein [Sphingomonas sp.]
MTIGSMAPRDAAAAMARGATLIDIRDADEHARERIPGALSVPLARLATETLPSGTLIFHCRSGMRTQANAATLALAGVDCHLLAGGIDAWRAAGLPTRIDRHQPLEIMRQVQLIAGGLVLLGAVLALAVWPWFVVLSAIVGAGLMMAGATGWCGMARLLRHMPWNRRTGTV